MQILSDYCRDKDNSHVVNARRLRRTPTKQAISTKSYMENKPMDSRLAMCDTYSNLPER